MPQFSIELDSETSIRLDHYVSECLPELSRNAIKAHIIQGMVKIDGKIIQKPSLKLTDKYEVLDFEPLETEESQLLAENIPLDIVYADDDIIVINKPVGLVVHPGAGNPKGTLVNALLYHFGEALSGIGGVARPGIVHRLDKDTSGLMVVAKHDQAHQRLAQQFESKSLKRRYIAYIMGMPRYKEGTITGNIGRSRVNRQKMTILHHGGKPATTHYDIMDTYRLATGALPFASKVMCELETGRTHQIRVHFTTEGFPLIGDTIYGNANKNKTWKHLLVDDHLWQNQRQALHAAQLHLVHPMTGETMRFKVPLPDDLMALEALLQENSVDH